MSETSAARPTVSIVIPVYNGRATLPRCIALSLAQTYAPIEVIVVDDGSTDDPARTVAQHSVRFLCQEHRGPAAARNTGARMAEGNVIAFTDADCMPHNDWIEQLVRALDEHTAAVGGTYDIGNPESRLSRLIHAEIQLRHERIRGAVDFLGSFNFACRKRAFEAVGGFDELFTSASGEDNDLTYRLRAAGYGMRFAPAAKVAHVHPDRLGKYLRAQANHGFWRVKLYTKHPRRISGDQYAPSTDLFGPPLLLAAVIVWAGAASTSVMEYGITGTGLIVGALMLTLVYVVLRLPLFVRIRWRAMGIRGLWVYPGLFGLRDLARGLGMVRGIWHFVVCRRTTR